jgi:RNA polymerase sigma-B factor
MTSVVTREPGDRASARLGPARSDRQLLEHFHEHGDAATRAVLIERLMPLARQLARRYQRGNEPIDDLVQVASMGLVKAVDRFDPRRGTTFSTFAVPTIVGELKRYLRDTTWAVHVPRGIQERVSSLHQASDELTRHLGRSPTTSELADELGLTAEEVLRTVVAASAYESASLDMEHSDSGGSREPVHANSLGRQDERFDLVEYEAAIAPGMMRLGHRERLILRLRFVEDLTQYEIAERIGLSQMHVSRLLRRTLDGLRVSAGSLTSWK